MSRILPSLCAACGSRVEDGAIQCPDCGAKLHPPGAFAQVFGFVLIAVATIPLMLSRVHTADVNYVPLAISGLVAVLGVFLVVWGKVRAKSAPPTTVPDTSAQTGTEP